MTNRFSVFPHVTRRAAMLGGLAALAGCADDPHIALDRETVRDFHAFSLPTPGFPARPGVTVADSVGRRMPGLIGLVAIGITATVESNRASALADLFRSQGFDARNAFILAVRDRLARHKLTLADTAAQPYRSDLLKTYDAVAQGDAVLDIVVTGYGFVAQNDNDDSPYRPSIGGRMRLVRVADRSVLAQDVFGHLGIDTAYPNQDANVPIIEFATFDAVKADPPGAVRALRAMIDYAADAIERRAT